MRAIYFIAIAAAVSACAIPSQGTVRKSQNNNAIVPVTESNPIVTVKAGTSDRGEHPGLELDYVIDTRTQTCWMVMGNNGSEFDCCTMLKVAEARPVVGRWLTDSMCAEASGGRRRSSESLPAAPSSPAP